MFVTCVKGYIGGTSAKPLSEVNNKSLYPSAQRTYSVKLVQKQRNRLALCKSNANKNDESTDKKNTGVEKAMKQLQQQGLDKKRAQEVLDKWQETGVQDPNALRKLFLKGSSSFYVTSIVQVIVDATAAYGGYLGAKSFAMADPFFGRILLEGAFYFLAFYFASGLVFDLFALGSLTFAVVKFGLNTENFVKAVKQIAGGSSTGLELLDKARTTVDTVKLLAKLEDIAELLKDQEGDINDGLTKLTAFLTLSNAREQRGFKPEDYDLTEEEATNIAMVFGKYDKNENFKLDVGEFKYLCTDLGRSLSNEEVKEALNIIDKDKNGYIDFDEFVRWYTKKIREEDIVPAQPVLSDQ